jgi:hypothetical protein
VKAWRVYAMENVVAYKANMDDHLSVNKEGWKEFHMCEDLEIEQDVIIIARITIHKNMNVMLVIDTIK